MNAPKKPSGVDEKIEQLEGIAHEVLEGAKESIARAEGSMEKAKEALGEGVGKVKTQTGEAYGKAKNHLIEARGALESARERMGELYGRSRELAEEAYDKAKVQFEKLSAEVRKGYAKVKAKVQEVDVKEVRDDVVNYIRRNPGKSILIALGVGFAIGYLVRRREP
ncbi:MAG TPA: DUF883 C-terminal domain-containing protein [Thermoanaerobaculaceae bacterium]|nr:DUF883 C-terminal domain-containing protein [Thermoanaerobaculaceae bacterium]